MTLSVWLVVDLARLRLLDSAGVLCRGLIATFTSNADGTNMTRTQQDSCQQQAALLFTSSSNKDEADMLQHTQYRLLGAPSSCSQQQVTYLLCFVQVFLCACRL